MTQQTAEHRGTACNAMIRSGLRLGASWPCLRGPTRQRAWGAMLILCLACLGLTACSGYQLQGTVIHGDVAGVLVVDPEDPRLSQHGLSDVTLTFTLDPERMSPRRLGSEITDQAGRFAKPVDAPGAGFLQYDLGILARGAGLADLWQILPMPGANKRLLIIMTQGRGGGAGAGDRPEDLLNETLRLKEQLVDR